MAPDNDTRQWSAKMVRRLGANAEHEEHKGWVLRLVVNGAEARYE